MTLKILPKYSGNISQQCCKRTACPPSSIMSAKAALREPPASRKRQLQHADDERNKKKSANRERTSGLSKFLRISVQRLVEAAAAATKCRMAPMSIAQYIIPHRAQDAKNIVEDGGCSVCGTGAQETCTLVSIREKQRLCTPCAIRLMEPCGGVVAPTTQKCPRQPRNFIRRSYHRPRHGSVVCVARSPLSRLRRRIFCDTRRPRVHL